MVVTPELLRSFSVLKTLADNDLLGLAQQSSLRKFTRRGIVLNAGEKKNMSAYYLKAGYRASILPSMAVK